MLLMVVLPAIVASSAHAQLADVGVGDRVRVTAPRVAIDRLTTVVLAGDTGRLTIRAESGGPLELSSSDITLLEVRRVRSRREGAWRGLKWGLAIGTLVGLYSLSTPLPAGESFSETTLALEAVGYGALIGASIGAWKPGKAWHRADPARVRVPVVIAVAPRVDTQPARAKVSSPRAGKTPIVEFTGGISLPPLPTAQFPGLNASLGVNLPRSRRYGATVVGEADLSHLRNALMAGVKLYGRTGALFERPWTLTYFAQGMAGQVRGGRSGVVHSNGGAGKLLGGGVDLGGGDRALRLQVDYRDVPGGVVRDDRVTTGPIASLSGIRVVIGATYRIGAR